MNIRYTDAIEWISNNDEPTLLEIKDIQATISVCLIADLFHKDVINVASDISLYRRGFMTQTFAKALRMRK